MTKKNILIFAIVSIVCIALALTAFFLIIHKDAGPAETIKDFETALNKNNLSKMLDCIDPEKLNTAETLLGGADSSVYETIEKIIKLLPFISYVNDVDLFPEFDIEILNEDIHSETATERIRAVNRKNAKDYTLDVYMVKIENRWYITGSKFVTDAKE